MCFCLYSQINRKLLRMVHDYYTKLAILFLCISDKCILILNLNAILCFEYAMLKIYQKSKVENNEAYASDEYQFKKSCLPRP